MKKFSILILPLLLIAVFYFLNFGKQTPENTKTSQVLGTKKITQVISNTSASELKTLLNDPNLNIIDVRTDEEFNESHLANAKNINYYSEDFEQQISKRDKNKKYLIYCRSGNRSGKTLELMKKLNFTNVTNLSGGILTIDSNLLCTGEC